MSPSPETIESLREAYSEGNIVVFAGAGVSQAAGLPGWTELAKMLRDRVRSDAYLQEIDAFIVQRKLIAALSAIRQAMGRTEFCSAVEEALDDRPFEVPDVAAAIASLRPRLKAMITTNLDRFLERAFEGAWDAITRAPGDLAQRRGFILKLHGTLMERSSWVFDRAEYDKAIYGAPGERAVLRALLHSSHLLFIGFGLDDDDTDQLFAQVRALQGQQPPTHFALLKQPIGPYHRKVCDETGIRILEYAEHAEVPDLLRRLAHGGGDLPTMARR